MNKELKNEYIENIMETTFKHQKSMKSYFEKEISNVVKLSAGLLAFRKPRVKTHFCYSYDEVMDCHGGTNTYETACYNARNVQEETFIKDNMEDLNRQLRMLQQEKIYYIKRYYRNDLTINFVSQGYADTFPSEIIAEATDEDVKILIEAVKEEIEKFSKRLRTYLKKYGTSKLRTWTYSIND